jgi:hypothetical protein
VESHAAHAAAQQDGLALLAIIRKITHTFEEQQKLSDALCDVKERFYSFHQKPGMTLQKHYEGFLDLVQVIESVEPSIMDNCLIKEIAVAAGRNLATSTDDDKTKAYQQALAALFIRGAGVGAKYLSHLRNDFLEGNDNYPSTLPKVYNVLLRRKSEEVSHVRQEDGVAFAQQNVVPGRNGRSYPHVTCHGCDEAGHYQDQCPSATAEQFQSQESTQLFTKGTSHLPETWILPHNQSTMDLFGNRKLLTNVRPSSTTMRVWCNAGTLVARSVTELPGYGTVWYDSGHREIFSR